MRYGPDFRIRSELVGSLALLTGGAGDRRVVLLHGNSSCKEAFAHQLPALLDAGCTVLAPDLPGHGASSDAVDPAATYSFSGYAGTIRRLIDQQNWPDYTVIGWSLGGHVALELMSSDPRIIGTLIVGTPPVKPCPEALHEAFLPTPDMTLASKPHFTPTDARTYVARMLGIDVAPPAELLAAALRTDGRARAMMVSSALAGVGTDARTLVARSPTPLAVLHGAHEAFVRFEYLTGLTYRNLWRGKIQVFDRDGHAPHWTNPVQFNAVMLDFLDHVANARHHAWIAAPEIRS